MKESRRLAGNEFVLLLFDLRHYSLHVWTHLRDRHLDTNPAVFKRSTSAIVTDLVITVCFESSKIHR